MNFAVIHCLLYWTSIASLHFIRIHIIVSPWITFLFFLFQIIKIKTLKFNFRRHDSTQFSTSLFYFHQSLKLNCEARITHPCLFFLTFILLLSSSQIMPQKSNSSFLLPFFGYSKPVLLYQFFILCTNLHIFNCQFTFRIF